MPGPRRSPTPTEPSPAAWRAPRPTDLLERAACPPTAKHPRSRRIPSLTANVYAFVSPDPARLGHADHQLHPATGSRGRAELLRVRRRRPLPDPHRQRRRREARRHLPVPLHHRGAQPAHVPLQHRTDRQPRQRQLEPAPVLLGAQARRPALPAARLRSAVSAVRHRPTVDARLRRPGRRRGDNPADG